MVSAIVEASGWVFRMQHSAPAVPRALVLRTPELLHGCGRGLKALAGTLDGCRSADWGFPARDSRVRREGR